MFQSRECFARLGKVGIDGEGPLVPLRSQVAETNCHAIVADTVRRPGVHRDNVVFESVETDAVRLGRMVASEQMFVLVDHLL